MHLGLPNWQYAFTQVGLDAQTLQWFRFLSPERLAIDIENRRQSEAIARKQGYGGVNRIGGNGTSYASALLSDKMNKVEGLKRKKRRMKLKAKGNADVVIEKFSAQSSKSAKYARSVIRKREPSEVRNFSNVSLFINFDERFASLVS